MSWRDATVPSALPAAAGAHTVPLHTCTQSVGPAALRMLPPDEEKARIVAALESAGGNITRAAETLEIGRRTLHKKLDAYGLR